MEGRYLTGRDKRQLSGVCIEAELIAFGTVESMDLVGVQATNHHSLLFFR